MITVPVLDYTVYIENGSLPHIGERLRTVDALKSVQTFAIVTDENVGALYEATVTNSLTQAGYKVFVITLPAGEQSKNIENYFAIQNWLAANKITRSDALIALGGGVVGDLTGFAAATYLRGVPFVQVPTSLLAMVDSSVGGKTGIDITSGKNLVGAFHQPSAVICDPDVLNTLKPEFFADGCAENIKHGMIKSTELLTLLQTKPIKENLPEIIKQNIQIKRDVVQADEFDKGERQLLNFGHTIGHAIEAKAQYTIPHGNAVAMGMSLITRNAVAKGLCPPDCLDVLEQLLQKCGLPNADDITFTPQEIFTAALTDKKRMGDTITEVIPQALGKCVLIKIPVSELQEWIGGKK